MSILFVYAMLVWLSTHARLCYLFYLLMLRAFLLFLSRLNPANFFSERLWAEASVTCGSSHQLQTAVISPCCQRTPANASSWLGYVVLSLVCLQQSTTAFYAFNSFFLTLKTDRCMVAWAYLQEEESGPAKLPAHCLQLYRAATYPAEHWATDAHVRSCAAAVLCDLSRRD